jgi:hypothetical protein
VRRETRRRAERAERVVNMMGVWGESVRERLRS